MLDLEEILFFVKCIIATQAKGAERYSFPGLIIVVYMLSRERGLKTFLLVLVDCEPSELDWRI